MTVAAALAIIALFSARIAFYLADEIAITAAAMTCLWACFGLLIMSFVFMAGTVRKGGPCPVNFLSLYAAVQSCFIVGAAMAWCARWCRPVQGAVDVPKESATFQTA
uniref:Uncharacterized protein n=1 Tax=Marseillevirus LCMAC103 TaxID=2506604 RepID=A0A481YUB3_9VIRU|nr:MAG: hypothetical protein LCMAC103_02310 [Marseillevirus LCMAC103]